MIQRAESADQARVGVNREVIPSDAAVSHLAIGPCAGKGKGSPFSRLVGTLLITAIHHYTDQLTARQGGPPTLFRGGKGLCQDSWLGLLCFPFKPRPFKTVWPRGDFCPSGGPVSAAGLRPGRESGGEGEGKPHRSMEGGSLRWITWSPHGEHRGSCYRC